MLFLDRFQVTSHFPYNKTRLLLRASFLFLLSACFAFVVACSKQGNQSIQFKLSGPTMGTTYNLTVIGADPALSQTLLQADIAALLSTLNQQMSTYINDSDLMLFNQASIGKPYPVDSELFEVVELSQEVARLSGGYFDITIGPLVELWGFGKNDIQHIPSDEALAMARNHVGWEYLVISKDEKSLLKKRPLRLDLSAVAKGYAVDKVAELLESRGISRYLVEIGGEMRVKGLNRQDRKWRVGIEKPALINKSAQQLVVLTDKAIATSGDYRNFFEQDGQRFSHTINPETGKPVKHKIASVSVISDTAAKADALATALNAMGEDAAIKLAEKLQLAAFFIFYSDGASEDDYRIFYSEPFKHYIQ